MEGITSTLTEPELAYLRGQRLGRLATVAPGGAPQNSPVGFHVNAELGSLDIYGLDMGATRKFRNVKVNPDVALVVDDVVSVDPWVVRGVEIRGTAEAIEDEDPPMPPMSRQVIRITPRRVISWGIDKGHPGRSARDVPATTTGTGGA
jgi:pyridoxamine 5'-phosphate oxidase family protein